MGVLGGKNAILCPRFLLNCYTVKQRVFLVTNLFKILFSWYIPLVKNKNTVFILAALPSNKLILMSCSQCKHKVECSAQFPSRAYPVWSSCSSSVSKEPRCSEGAAAWVQVRHHLHPSLATLYSLPANRVLRLYA